MLSGDYLPVGSPLQVTASVQSLIQKNINQHLKIQKMFTASNEVVNSVTALTPRWDTQMSFRIRLPELCLIRFCVRDQTGILSSDFVGQYTLPFKSLKKGEPQGRKSSRGWGVGVGEQCNEELNYIR